MKFSHHLFLTHLLTTLCYSYPLVSKIDDIKSTEFKWFDRQLAPNTDYQEKSIESNIETHKDVILEENKEKTKTTEHYLHYFR